MAGKTKAGIVFQCGGETETRIIPETWAAGLFGGETKKEWGVVKGKKVVVEWERESEEEEEEEENRGLYEAICYNAGPNWRNEYVANLSLMTQVNVNNGNRRLIRRM